MVKINLQGKVPSSRKRDSLMPQRRFNHILLSHEIEAGMQNLCGAKTVNLAILQHVLDIRTTPFFVITSDATWFYLRNNNFPGGFLKELREALKMMEKGTGQKFGKDLFVSVRAAGPKFMSGILHTRLDVGKTRSGAYSQLKATIMNVAASWNAAHARFYRGSQGYANYPCHAIIIQKMVHGDLNENSAAGAYFTRNRLTGEKESGLVAVRAKGDVVMSGGGKPRLFREYKELHPKPAGRVMGNGKLLEVHFRDAQEVEFAVEDSHAYILQTRSPDRSPQAAVRIALDLEKEGIVSKPRAAELVRPEHEAALLADTLDESSIRPEQRLAFGVGVAPGVGTGPLALDGKQAIKNPGSILVKNIVMPEDYKAMSLSQGIISFEDVLGVHTRSLALSLGIPAIARVDDMSVDLTNRRLIIKTSQGEEVLTEQDVISIDGRMKGRVFRGEVGVKKSGVAKVVERLSRAIVDPERFPMEESERVERLGRALLKIRKWRLLPKDPHAGKVAVEWPEVSGRAQKIPEIRDFERSVLITAFDILRRGSFGMDAIFDAIVEQEATEPGLWAEKPLSAYNHFYARYFSEYDHVFVKERGHKLFVALYHLDPDPSKRVCLALCNTRSGIHDDTRNFFATLPRKWAVLLLDGMIKAARHDHLKSDDHFFVFVLSSLAQNLSHKGIMDEVKPDTLAFFLEDYFNFRIRNGDTNSTSVQTGTPDYKKLKPVLESIDKERLALAFDLIGNDLARGFWRDELGVS